MAVWYKILLLLAVVCAVYGRQQSDLNCPSRLWLAVDDDLCVAGIPKVARNKPLYCKSLSESAEYRLVNGRHICLLHVETDRKARQDDYDHNTGGFLNGGLPGR